tara:strand:+ start:8659 stop:8856 length:198 start_codon:yes stop_codon:yes gene_type:complete
MDTDLPNLSLLEDKIKNTIVEIKRLRANENANSNSQNNFSKNDLKMRIQKIIDLIENDELYIGGK